MSQNERHDPLNRLYDIETRTSGPAGLLPITDAMLRERPSGDLFGLSQDAGMGWNPAQLNGNEYLTLSTHGGVRKEDGTAVALGYHTGHWELGLLVVCRSVCHVTHLHQDAALEARSVAKWLLTHRVR